jgi:hypothetical protein
VAVDRLSGHATSAKRAVLDIAQIRRYGAVCLDPASLTGNAPCTKINEMNSGVGTIEIERERARRRDRVRAYKVLIDETQVGVVRDGRSEVFSVTPGAHSVRLKLDWCKSNQVDLAVSDGDVLQLRCGPRGGSFTVITDALFRSSSYLRLEEVEP